jgi:excisionase family DNA binding protein
MPYKNDAPLAERRYLTIAEAAAYFRINHKTIRRAIAANEMPSHCFTRWGDAYRIDRVALEQHLSASEVQTNPAA